MKEQDKAENTGKLFLGNTALQFTRANNVCEKNRSSLGHTLAPRNFCSNTESLADHRYILLTGAKWLQNKGESVTNSRKWTDKVKITCYVLQTRSEMGRVPNLVEHLLRKKAK